MPKHDGESQPEENQDSEKFRSISSNEHFDPQPSRRFELPDPELFALNLTHRAYEVLQGKRDVGQIARWVTDDVYHAMQQNVLARQRKMSLLPQGERPEKVGAFTVSALHGGAPREGIFETCVLVRTKKTIRSAAIRLEGFDRRWRASAFTLL